MLANTTTGGASNPLKTAVIQTWMKSGMGHGFVTGSRRQRIMDNSQVRYFLFRLKPFQHLVLHVHIFDNWMVTSIIQLAHMIIEIIIYLSVQKFLQERLWGESHNSASAANRRDIRRNTDSYDTFPQQ